jgi:hypothetical protein
VVGVVGAFEGVDDVVGVGVDGLSETNACESDQDVSRRSAMTGGYPAEWE